MDKLKVMLDFVKQVYEKVEPFVPDNSKAELAGERDALVKRMEEGKNVKMPIVGNFNAGKSALLNAVLGRGVILPENIQPETAIPYELYPTDGEEKVELFRNGILESECPLAEISQLNTHPGDVAKVYVNNRTVAELAAKGITLVDMPGSDSGVKAHNEAISNYICNGSVFVFLMDVSLGALSRTSIAYLQEIEGYCVESAVLLSKCDLQPESKVNEIKEYVALQVATNLAKGGLMPEAELMEGATGQGDAGMMPKPFVGCVSAARKEIDDFMDYIGKLDANSILFERFKSAVVAFVNHAVQCLTAYQVAVRYSPKSVDNEINKLQKQKEAIVNELNDNPQNADTPEKSTQDILDMVKAEIDSKAEVIAESVVNNEPVEELSALIISILRPVLIRALIIEGEQYASALSTVVDDVSQKLLANLHIDSGMVDSIVDEYREGIQGIVAMVAEVLKNNPHVYARIIGYVLSLVGQNIPDIIRWIFGKSHDDIVNEAAEKIRTLFYPSIQESLYPELLQLVKEQQKRIRDSVRENMEKRIGQIEAAIQAVAEKGRQDKELADKEVEKIEIVKGNILEQQKTILNVVNE